MRNETKEILDGICKMRRTQSPDSYTYSLDDKKVLHVFENPKTSQLSFLVNNATNGDQYFLTDCDISDEKGILETVEYIVSRYIRPTGITAVRVTVEKKASIARTFYATPDQLQQIRMDPIHLKKKWISYSMTKYFMNTLIQIIASRIWIMEKFLQIGIKGGKRNGIRKLDMVWIRNLYKRTYKRD